MDLLLVLIVIAAITYTVGVIKGREGNTSLKGLEKAREQIASLISMNTDLLNKCDEYQKKHKDLVEKNIYLSKINNNLLIQIEKDKY